MLAEQATSTAKLSKTKVFSSSKLVLSHLCTNTQQPQSSSRLLDLPAELYLKIIDLVVKEPQPITICYKGFRRFFDLPDELRIMIMEQAEFSPNLIQRFATWRAMGTDPIEYVLPKPPALAHVCKGLRVDALEAFFELNTFTFRFLETGQATRQLAAWLKSLDDGLVGLVKVNLYARCCQRYIGAVVRDDAAPGWAPHCRCRDWFAGALYSCGVSMMADGMEDGHVLWKFALTAEQAV